MIDGTIAPAAALFAIASLANWWSRWSADVRLEYATKPAASIFVIALAVGIEAPSRWEQAWVVAGLGLCLLGDVVLMLPKDRFVAGLASFLLGHVAFIVGYGLSPRAGNTAAAIAAVAVVAILLVPARGILESVRSEQPGLFAPVVAYVAVILVMVVSVARGVGWMGLSGAATFAISDTVLAWGRFVPGSHRESRLLAVGVMVTYHAALFQIALALR